MYVCVCVCGFALDTTTYMDSQLKNFNLSEILS